MMHISQNIKSKTHHLCIEVNMADKCDIECVHQ